MISVSSVCLCSCLLLGAVCVCVPVSVSVFLSLCSYISLSCWLGRAMSAYMICCTFHFCHRPWNSVDRRGREKDNGRVEGRVAKSKNKDGRGANRQKYISRLLFLFCGLRFHHLEEKRAAGGETKKKAAGKKKEKKSSKKERKKERVRRDTSLARLSEPLFPLIFLLSITQRYGHT